MENKAFELGRQQHPWWPDWREKPAVILASGPSAGNFPFDRLREMDVGVIAIKVNIDKVPWAPVCYGCDAPWWVSRQGLPNYKGIRLAHGDQAIQRFPGLIHRVNIDPSVHKILIETPLRVGSGMNSGFQAINLAIQFGARKILLVGYDFHIRSGLHWYGRNTWVGTSNPTANQMFKWIDAMKGIAPWLKEHGVDVINASNSSEIKCFRRGSLDDLSAHAAAA